MRRRAMLVKVAMPMMPTTIMIRPTRSRLTLSISQSVAKVRIAPTATRPMHPPMPMNPASCYE